MCYTHGLEDARKRFRDGASKNKKIGNLNLVSFGFAIHPKIFFKILPI